MLPTKEESVLVTGFPSFRGRKMVQELRTGSPGTRVFAVVHPKLVEQATAFIGQLDPEQRDRVVAFEGDAAAIDLGLSGKEYRELAARVQRIHHVAQVTYPGV